MKGFVGRLPSALILVITAGLVCLPSVVQAGIVATGID